MRMFNSKKGVSEVVANVLIVLLVIVGIAVIWSVVKPTIDKGAAGVQADCFTVAVEPVSCTPNIAGVWNVTVKRNPGDGEFQAIELVFEDASGASERFANATAVTSAVLGELETVTLIGTETLGTGLTVNTVVRTGDQLCQITTEPITCA